MALNAAQPIPIGKPWDEASGNVRRKAGTMTTLAKHSMLRVLPMMAMLGTAIIMSMSSNVSMATRVLMVAMLVSVAMVSMASNQRCQGEQPWLAGRLPTDSDAMPLTPRRA